MTSLSGPYNEKSWWSDDKKRGTHRDRFLDLSDSPKGLVFNDSVRWNEIPSDDHILLSFPGNSIEV